MNEVAPDILLSPTQSELKPLCVVSNDDVADDTPVTPERIEPKSVTKMSKSLDSRASNPIVEVRARYLDTSSGSCHDFCKYGHKNVKESTSSFIAKQKKKLAVNSKALSEPNVENSNQPQVAKKKIDRVPKLSISPEKSTIKRLSSLSAESDKNDKKSVILRNGISGMNTLSKGKKKDLVLPNAPKPPIKKEFNGKSKNVENPKEDPRLKKLGGVGKGEKKQLLNEKISEEKLDTDGNERQSAVQTCFENKKGKQKTLSSGAVSSRSSLISCKTSLGIKREQNALSKDTKKADGILVSKGRGTKTLKQMSKEKAGPVSWPKRVVKKVGLEEKNDSTHKLAFKRGKVVDAKTNNTAPRRLKFKPRKVVEDLSLKADDVTASKTERVKLMTNPKVGINSRLKRVGKFGVEGKSENSAHKLNFERGKTIDVPPKNTAPRRLKFKPRKVIVDNVNVDNSRRNLKKVIGVDEVKGSNTEHLRVVLKHQEVEGKKDVQSLLNNVIEETATRLVRLRKSKVKALVGAFESLMSLPDAKSSTNSAS